MRGFLVGLFCLSAATICLAGETSQRIVVAGSGLTEIVHALGAGDRLVGVDTTSLFPARAGELPQIGYLRALSAEGILSLRPNLLLATEDAGPPAVLQQLSSAGLEVLRAREGFEPEAVAARIEMVGRALGKESEAAALQATLLADIARVQAALPVAGPKPRVLFLLAAGSAVPMVSGRDTAASAMIVAAGGVNAVDAYRGYKPLTPEAIALAAPDFVLTTEQSLVALGGREALLRLPAFAVLARSGGLRVLSYDAVYLLGFGPRTAHALRDLAAAIHPARQLPALPHRPWLEARF
ncbi:MAG: ABC transporter substrate-binding protein [Telmatospirillum sp.]|nr:ABC transporter substrate-binding protein [Telmatospirillum sp.]